MPQGSRKRKLKVRWSCSDYTRHEHRWLWTARLCGFVQWMIGYRGKGNRRRSAFMQFPKRRFQINRKKVPAS